ncbi:ATP-binding protein [Magnetospirillum sp. 64-120]|uniref:ATP-binding protein n=1 Tax=Magnetospirillum sp. 64-120 TaxID=1895778 RepID=UPI0009277338|nr:ATP-binding protein [Magnetospirillum sp. 64-120]OJX75194.1 MAG: histidine kinase [Magnetospirillum sp. 64-120]
MISGPVVVAVSIGYLLVLFAIAWIGDRRAAQGRSPINNSTTYVLSMAVFCTSWTFYGSVGRAAQGGLAFLPIYLGPTLVVALSGVIIGKMVHIGRSHRITSIADFISARYGKSTVLGGIVTIIAVTGIMPYISLQLKAVSTTLTALLDWPNASAPISDIPVLGDTVLLVALFLAAFAILFGTRHIDASEHHQGMVLAIAFESVIKLVAFLAVGAFVTYHLHDGFADIFQKAAANPDMHRLFTIQGSAYGDWVALVVLSMLAFTCLPRQFQVTVVENTDRRHVDRMVWLFPLYLLAINIFVLPVALAGRMAFGEQISPDLYVLALPLSQGAEALAMLVFLGGLSAAASMVIVETIALATMVSNDLLMPLLLRLRWLDLSKRADLSGLLLTIRRATIAAVVLLGYAYVRLIGDSYALVTIGLTSFAAAAQFAPALIGGILWKGATEKGAMAGLLSGFAIWLYTLLLPNFARSGWLPLEFAEQGLAGIEFLKPYALFGLSGLEPVTHSLVWSMLANVGAYVLVSLLTGHTALERIQASLFVDALRPTGPAHGRSRFWRGTASVAELRALCVRFVGLERADRAFAQWAEQRGIDLDRLTEAGSDLVDMAETLLAGAIGTASARVMVASVSKGEVVGLDEVMEILDEASQIIAYSQRLEAATAELKEANARLKELDRMKDDFISTVTHELRTPLTSIRSFSEILFDNPGMEEAQRQEFLSIVIKESERLTRLINQVLDMAKLESGRMAWTIAPASPRALVEDCVAATHALFEDKEVTLDIDLAQVPQIATDADKFMQVVINLLSNAVKFVDPAKGRVRLSLSAEADGIRLRVADNGPGLPVDSLEKVFDRFLQVGDTMTNKPKGTGLGLAISKTIVEHLGGRIWAENAADGGAVFTFTLPALPPS